MTAFDISPPERAAIGVALLMLALQALAPGELLEYRQDVLASEPWRALSGHTIHVNWPHALINAAALWLVARLFAPEMGARRQLVVLIAAALGISLALAWLYPSIAWYRGLSGALHGLFFAGATQWLVAGQPRAWRTLWLPAVLVAGGWVKVALEQPGGAATPYAEWLGAQVVPQAHLIGAAAGTILGTLSAALSARREHQRRQP